MTFRLPLMKSQKKRRHFLKMDSKRLLLWNLMTPLNFQAFHEIPSFHLCTKV